MRTSSVLGGPLSLIDDEYFNRGFRPYEFEAELILDGIHSGLEHASNAGGRSPGVGRGPCADLFHVEIEIVIPGEPGLINDRHVGTKTRKIFGQPCHVYVVAKVIHRSRRRLRPWLRFLELRTALRHH